MPLERTLAGASNQHCATGKESILFQCNGLLWTAMNGSGWSPTVCVVKQDSSVAIDSCMFLQLYAWKPRVRRHVSLGGAMCARGWAGKGQGTWPKRARTRRSPSSPPRESPSAGLSAGRTCPLPLARRGCCGCSGASAAAAAAAMAWRTACSARSANETGEPSASRKPTTQEAS